MMDTASDFIGQLGYWGIFLGSIIEALGVPFPGGVMMVLAGILINEGRIDFGATLFLAVIGLNSGATAAYYIGKFVGEPFLYRFERLFKVKHEKIFGARAWLEQSSSAFVLFGRFVPMAGNLTPYLAGISGLRIFRFIFYNSIFALGWSLFNIGLGYYFSQTWRSIMDFTETRLPYLAVVAIFIYLLAAVFIRKKAIKKSNSP
ncbi:MAG: DedA family protein [Bacillota bacterium]